MHWAVIRVEASSGFKGKKVRINSWSIKQTSTRHIEWPLWWFSLGKNLASCLTWNWPLKLNLGWSSVQRNRIQVPVYLVGSIAKEVGFAKVSYFHLSSSFWVGVRSRIFLLGRKNGQPTHGRHSKVDLTCFVYFQFTVCRSLCSACWILHPDSGSIRDYIMGGEGRLWWLWV